MSSTIVKPDVPYKGEIPGKIQPGWMCRIQGVTHPDAERFNINLQAGSSSDLALHLSVRLNQGYIARNTKKDGSWGDEQGDGDLPIGPAQSWEIIILVDQQDYKIAVNGQHFCEFPFRIPSSEVSHLSIDGDVSITLISWEGIGGVGVQNANQLNSQTPQQGYQQQPNNPQANYNYNPQVAPGYGPPPPPGVEPESGFESFFEQAQTVLAGAIKSGAAEKLLGGLLGGGGGQQQQGYAHQNAKYGLYPDLPQDLDPNYQDPKQQQQQQRRGPVESLLMNFLSGGDNQQQQQQRQQQQQGGLDLNSLLGNLLGGQQQQQQFQNQQQQHQTRENTDLNAFLGNLMGGQQQQNPRDPNSVRDQGSLDLSSLLSGLMSSGQTQQQQQQQSGSNRTTEQQRSDQSGLDLNHIMGALSGLMAHTRPVQETGGSTTAQQSQGEKGAGVDFNAILANLLAGGDQGQQRSGSDYGQQRQGNHGGPDYGQQRQGNQGGSDYGQQVPPGGDYGRPRAPVAPPQRFPKNSSGEEDSRSSQPASNEQIEDVSDQLADVIAAEGGGRGQQYGQYPHPPQQERGPVEGLLSNFLGGGGGGGQQTRQQPSNFGGGESVGGLGSMGGILSGLAGSLLQPRDNQNQRQNY